MKKNNSDTVANRKMLQVVDFSKNSMELYLKEEYGIDDVLAVDSMDLRQDKDFRFDVSTVRGNIQLQLGKIRTPQEYIDKLNMVVDRLKRLNIL